MTRSPVLCSGKLRWDKSLGATYLTAKAAVAERPVPGGRPNISHGQRRTTFPDDISFSLSFVSPLDGRTFHPGNGLLRYFAPEKSVPLFPVVSLKMPRADASFPDPFFY